MSSKSKGKKQTKKEFLKKCFAMHKCYHRKLYKIKQFQVLFEGINDKGLNLPKINDLCKPAQSLPILNVIDICTILCKYNFLFTQHWLI